jgi:hypothetical protein
MFIPKTDDDDSHRWLVRKVARLIRSVLALDVDAAMTRIKYVRQT